MYALIHVKRLLFLTDETNFLDRFSKNTLSYFLKIRSVGAELFHADGRSGRHDEADISFPQFCQSAK